MTRQVKGGERKKRNLTFSVPRYTSLEPLPTSLDSGDRVVSLESVDRLARGSGRKILKSVSRVQLWVSTEKGGLGELTD